MKVNDKVKVISPDTQEAGGILDNEAVTILRNSNYTGTITQIKQDTLYVTFTHNGERLTQLYKEEEVQEVEQ